MDKDNLRKLLIKADSFISHMYYRRFWPGNDQEIFQLISDLREAAKELENETRS